MEYSEAMATLSMRRLEYFLGVIDYGTVTAAAEHLLVAQPALSRQLKVLENELGMKLFDLRGNRLILTPAARAFAPVARELVRRAVDAERAVHDIRSGRVRMLRVAAPAPTIRTVVAPFAATLAADDPLLIAESASHLEIYQSLYHGADLVISPLPSDPGLAWVELAAVPLRVFAAPGHPLAESADEVSIGDLARHRIVAPPPTSISRMLLDQAVAGGGGEYMDLIDCDDGPALHALARTGRVAAVTTEPPVDMSGLVDRLLISFDGRPLELTLRAAWLEGHHAATAIIAIVDRLRSFIAARPEGGRALGRDPKLRGG
jgi:DNA-binding transcriptional LysR family regulator